MKYGLLFVALLFGQILAPLPAHAAARKKARHAAAVTGHHARPAQPAEQDEPVAVAPIDPSKPPEVRAQSVIVVDADNGEILYEKDPDVQRQIASTTKLLTSLIVAESGDLLQQVVVYPIDTICEPTKLYFKPGEAYSRRSLLYALLVHSCNDVARCLARDNAGSIPEFAARMNRRAAELGALHSHFVNPNGLPSPGEEQYSTARDLARIARAAHENLVLRPIMATQKLVFQYADGRTREFTNTNRVLGRYPLCTGMKTGYTDAAGHCLVSSATSGTKTVIAVCLGDNKMIWNDSQRLLMWALAERGHPDAQASTLAPASPSLLVDGRSVPK